MTHDPLCHLSRETGEFNLMAGICYHCKLIAKVRADERKQCVTEIEDAHASVDEDGRRWHHCDYLVAHAALERAADRLRTAS
jgi:hypothetical protein